MEHKQPQKSTNTPKQVSDKDLEKVTGGNVPAPSQDTEKIVRFEKERPAIW